MKKQLKAQQCSECYQVHLLRAFNKIGHLQSFQVSDLVLAIFRSIITTNKTINKFTLKWNEPYVVQEVYANGAYKIIVEDGLRVGPINNKFLKCSYT